MSKEKLKGFISGIVVMMLLFSVSISVFAANGNQTITTTYRDIKVYIDNALTTMKDANGKTVEPFLYDGTTYVPLRAVGQALGKEVSWDSKTSSIYIGKQPEATTKPAVTTPEVVKYSKYVLAPVGTSQTVDYADKYNADVTVTDVLRGDDAWNKIKAMDSSNKAPDKDMEYVLAKVKVTLNTSKEKAAIPFSADNFKAYSSSDKAYDAVKLVLDPAFNAKLEAGKSADGYVAFAVNKTDKSPKLMFADSSDKTGGFWFALSK